MESFENMSAGAKTIYKAGSFLEDSFIQAARMQLPEGIRYFYTNSFGWDDLEERLGYELRDDYRTKVLKDLRTYLFGEDGNPDARNPYSGNLCIVMEQMYTGKDGLQYKARAIGEIGSLCKFTDYEIAEILESSSALFFTVQTREDKLYRYSDEGVSEWHLPAGCEHELPETRQLAIRQLTDVGQRFLDVLAATDSDTLIDIWDNPALCAEPDYSSKQAVRSMLEEAACWGMERQEYEEAQYNDIDDLDMDEER